ncbi:AAA family ATPase [Epidermidibacterium keratini]|uniref:AAA family ATPase n=1 Tax=Epidermidibacterium keratini TaxID=1891644 RepID=A0A7L4YML6_9ACTN|nr:UvrD-helicase domain-containing protein [Epidermidibacterium keratini]QHC00531.1 AAA family ATPase [Epidermidibacterium keratini]
MTDAGRRDAIAEEQHHLDEAVRRRDTLIADLAQRGDPTSRERATALGEASDSVVFGRIDTTEREQWRIGRVGIRDEDGDPLVLDWRAPIARAFYTATAADPQGLRSRRYITTDGSVVTGVDDEPLTGELAGLGELVGEAALLNALDARRTGQLTQVVATLQREQDEIVRAAPQGALVVQGGPGTGKTVVALHRAAYLLFTHDRIAQRGVLVVGPNDRFLRYIDQVLPSLGETQVASLSPARLLPGIVAGGTDTDAAARIKGDPVWAEILPRAVAERRPEPAALSAEWAGTPITIDKTQMRRIITEIEVSDEALHVQRERYVDAVTEALAAGVAAESQRALEEVEAGLEDVLAVVDRSLARDDRVAPRRADAIGADVTGRLDATDSSAIAAALVADPEVEAALEQIWPTPTRATYSPTCSPIRCH